MSNEGALVELIAERQDGMKEEVYNESVMVRQFLQVAHTNGSRRLTQIVLCITKEKNVSQTLTPMMTLRVVCCAVMLGT